MVRTQIYLDEQQYNTVKQRAKLAGKPSAELIREFIDLGLRAQSRTSNTDVNGILELAATGLSGGPSDLSANLDDYLYGAAD